MTVDDKQLHELMEGHRADARSALDADQLRELSERLAADPAAQRRQQRIQQWDQRIEAALQRVPVPAGLSDRLLSACQAELAAGDASEGDTDRHPVQPSVGLPVKSSRWSRRQVLSAVTAVAAAVALLATAVFFGLSDRDPLGGPELALLSQQWREQLDPEKWQLGAAPLETHSPDASLRLSPVQWQRLRALSDNQAVAYRAALPPDGATIILFVVHTSKGQPLPSLPPYDPDSSTGGWSVGSWRNDDALYVLAVNGPADLYRNFVRSSTQLM